MMIDTRPGCPRKRDRAFSAKVINAAISTVCDTCKKGGYGDKGVCGDCVCKLLSDNGLAVETVVAVSCDSKPAEGILRVWGGYGTFDT